MNAPCRFIVKAFSSLSQGVNKVMSQYPALLRPRLTRREMEIAVLVSQGLSNKRIGLLLGLREGTVKMHLHNVYAKTQLSNRTSLAMWLKHPLEPVMPIIVM